MSDKLEEGEVSPRDEEPRRHHKRRRERDRGSRDTRHRKRERTTRRRDNSSDRHSSHSRRSEKPSVLKERIDEINGDDIILSSDEDESGQIEEEDPIEASRRRRRAIAESAASLKPQSGAKEQKIAHQDAFSTSERPTGPEKSDSIGVDIFSSSFDVNKLLEAHEKEKRTNLLDDTSLEQHLSSNWDDTEGYYIYRIGEVINDQYRVKRLIGKGMFATVLEGQDVESLRPVAIKILRNVELMAKSGRKEIEILKILQLGQTEEATLQHKRDVNCIEMLDSLVFRNHVCIVFDAMAMNMREVLSKYGRQTGLSIQAVKIYARQLFVALRHLRRNEILHADIKPDNILVNDTKNVLRLADFGSAFKNDEAAVTPILVSRFYRAPEIMLGLPYTYSIDMWAVGCTLFELYTGTFLFAGRDNNHMIQLIQEYRGRISLKLLKKGAFSGEHFDQHFNFLKREVNEETNEEIIHPVVYAKPTKDLKTRLLMASNSASQAEKKEVLLLGDLLEKIFVIDPEKRITPQQALSHEFVIRR